MTPDVGNVRAAVRLRVAEERLALVRQWYTPAAQIVSADHIMDLEGDAAYWRGVLRGRET